MVKIRSLLVGRMKNRMNGELAIVVQQIRICTKR